MRFGKFVLYPLSDGTFALDGGAMFGVVPRVMWEKKRPPDSRNRITLGLNPLLVDTKNELVLIDTGIGDKFSRKSKEIYFVDRSTNLVASLQARGVEPSDIEMVILTHLHFDHCGGNTKRNKAGAIVPAFPHARYFVQKTEWEAASNPDPRSRASYLEENFKPLGSQLELISRDTIIVDGITAVLTSGHTRGHQCVKIESGDKTAIYWGDLIPTSSHLKLPYVMSYDIFPLITMEQKERLLREAIEGDWLSIFEHDPEVTMAYLTGDNENITCKPIHE